MKVEFEIYRDSEGPKVLGYTWSGINSAGITPAGWFAAISQYCLGCLYESSESSSPLIPPLTDDEINSLRDLLHRWAK